ncbi:unnamed protein product [Dicrocoelium dendriticum]|nr:unnamed protein product [Dicrocoelium dendriticum]
MNFSFSIGDVLPDELTCIRSTTALYSTFRNNLTCKHKEELSEIIDKMGASSATAQSLPRMVTTCNKFWGSGHSIFILSNIHQNMVFGILKVGRKRLFLHDERGIYTEAEPLCILDFYVHESVQRRGFGKKLFDFMLQVEQMKPSSLAIDSPSEKMLRFLEKHYHLTHPVFASNNFVVYPDFFRIHACNTRTARQDFCGKTNEVVQNTSKPVVAQTRYSLNNAPCPILHSRFPAIPTNMPAIKESTSFTPTSTDHTESGGYITSTKGLVSGANVGKHMLNVSTELPNTQSHFSWNSHAQHHSRSDHSVVSPQQLRFLRELPTNSRLQEKYSYLKAVRSHNAHKKLW